MEVKNRKAYFNYEVLDTIEVGVVLKGTEIKSIRNAHVSLDNSYAVIKNDEVYLLNTFIKQYKEGNIYNHDESRSRKLLLHKKEIKKLKDAIEKERMTLIPLKLYFVKNKVKILIGVCRGKKNYDKRESLKEKDMKRNLEKRGKYEY
ncbi:MAG: SsrA-binding protein [Clostridiales bacterium]|jgi:ssrA-binding protein|nr:SsrA-binding protein [Clostridiales bacterium]